MRRVICSINIEFVYPDANDDLLAEDLACDEALPDNYVEESFEVVKVLKE